MPKQFKLPRAHRLPQGWLSEYWGRAGGVVYRVCPNQPQATQCVLPGATLAQRRQVPEWVSEEAINAARLTRARMTTAVLYAMAAGAGLKLF